MAINYAEKYSAKVDERFAKAAITPPIVNDDYDFVGVNAVNVYSVPTVAMNNYSMTGTARYGTPSELQDSVQTMALSRDRAFTFSVDRRNHEDTMMTHEAGKALRRQLDEVVIPEIDVYRLATIIANAGNSAAANLTATNAYASFLDGVNAITNAKAPAGGRVAYIGTRFYKLIRLDPAFIKASDVAQTALFTGQVGQIDGIPLVLAPDSYFPLNFDFLITNKIATVAPVKLSEYKVHENPPGINGWLVEGRFYYDAFVLNNKKNAIYVHTEAA
jgi:N4-gp56 family major capsid protein